MTARHAVALLIGLPLGSAIGRVVVGRIHACYMRRLERNVSGVDAVCKCGHTAGQHIYHDGACRPGFVCPARCGWFDPAIPGRRYWPPLNKTSDGTKYMRP